MNCPKCGSRAWYRTLDGVGCWTCGWQYSRAAVDAAYAAELRAEASERPTSHGTHRGGGVDYLERRRAKERRYRERVKLAAHQERAIGALYEGSR